MAEPSEGMGAYRKGKSGRLEVAQVRIGAGDGKGKS
jgi:hypothetical protein